MKSLIVPAGFWTGNQYSRRQPRGPRAKRRNLIIGWYCLESQSRFAKSAWDVLWYLCHEFTCRCVSSKYRYLEYYSGSAFKMTDSDQISDKTWFARQWNHERLIFLGKSMYIEKSKAVWFSLCIRVINNYFKDNHFLWKFKNLKWFVHEC